MKLEIKDACFYHYFFFFTQLEDDSKSAEGIAAIESGAIEVVASEEENVNRKKDFTGYRVYRVVVPSIEAAEWILKFEELPGVEFWADPKLLLRPRGVFVTSAADLMVSPNVVDEVEAALRQARMPFEILIKDVQVSSMISEYRLMVSFTT